MKKSVRISPGVGMLSLLSHLNYKPWFALAEFVDNSLQSFLYNQEQIKQLDGVNALLEIEIELDIKDGGRLLIRDNAGGIHEDDYARAFKPAEVPPDRSGLSEFGIGMKSAACWFASDWSVRTSAIGETFSKTIRFNITEIVEGGIEELEIQYSNELEEAHYTEICLTNLKHLPQKKTVSKIKSHLSSIYRVFIKQGILKLTFNQDELVFESPPILSAPYYKEPDSQPVLWRKEIDFDFGNGLVARGFAAIRAKASTSDAGFALFRRDRLIQGSREEGYRPEYIFKKANSYTYQRLFGELHLDGFSVSHTKDGFQWDEQEEPFLEILREVLDEAPCPILKQAEGYRVRQKTSDLRSGAEQSTQNTAKSVKQNVPPITEQQVVATPTEVPPPSELPSPKEYVANRNITISIDGVKWEISIELVNDPAIGDWLTIGDSSKVGDRRTLEIRMSLAHPFVVQFGGIEAEKIEPLLRMAVAIALAEIAARDSGVRKAGTFRRNINQLLRDALSQP